MIPETPKQETNDEPFDLRQLLCCERKKPLRFSEFIELFMEKPEEVLKTSAGIILEAIKHFGLEIIVRSGTPTIRYKVFSDPFADGINAVYGQEFCIRRVIDVIESVEREAGPKRGIILVGPPASGKTNIVDLISQAMEEYTKQMDFKLYTFAWRLNDHADKRELELRSALTQNPILLLPTSIEVSKGKVIKPRLELFNEVQQRHGGELTIPSFYQYATPDKRTLDILSALTQNPRNADKSMFDILEEYIRVEELTFSNAQGRGIANIDEMKQLQTYVRPFTLAPEDVSLLNEHMQGKFMFKYEGPMLNSNRGLLHIHDAFESAPGGYPSEHDYKPLLMLLGSGKVNLEATQAPIDNTVIITTNLDEMKNLEKQLTSSKLLDRIEKVPVNYLLDATAEMDILRRDMSTVMNKYDVDPNLLTVASFYSVLTRLFAPHRKEFPPEWNQSKKDLYANITPEQKLMIYCQEPADPAESIRSLPAWHPFRNQCFRLGINIFNEEVLKSYIVTSEDTVRLEESGLFSRDELALIDDEFMRLMREEHYPLEGQYGLSIRQLQNIMRNTISSSDGIKLTANLFLTQLEKIFAEGASVHHWLSFRAPHNKKGIITAREIGTTSFTDAESNFEDYSGLIKVVKAIYFTIISREITISTVDRNPKQIESDMRRYLQHALLANAVENKAFSHLLIPKYTYIDTATGLKVDKPDIDFMSSIEKILKPKLSPVECRAEVTQKFLQQQDAGKLKIEEGRSIITSNADKLLDCFSEEFNQLLSHHRAIAGIDPKQISNGFFYKINDLGRFERCPEEVQNFVDHVLANMSHNFGYSEEIALDIIIFALREKIVDISQLIH